MERQQNDPAKRAAIENAIIAMEDPAIQGAVERMIWEGSPSGDDPFMKNSRFPERVDRTKPE